MYQQLVKMGRSLGHAIGEFVEELWSEPAKMRPARRARPRLEGLGERVVPATYRWYNSLGNGVGGDGRNWKNEMGVPYAQGSSPSVVTDHLIFNNGWSNANCTYNAAGNLNLGNVTFDMSYSGTVTLNANGAGTVDVQVVTWNTANTVRPELAVGTGDTLNANGQLNLGQANKGSIAADTVYVKGGGTNSGNLQLNVNVCYLDSDYTLRNGIWMARSGSRIENVAGKTFTVTPLTGVNAAIGSDAPNLAATPYFKNFGNLRIQAGNMYFTEVPFKNDTTGDVEIETGVYVEFFTTTANTYAFHQYGAASTAGPELGIAEGSTMWASNNTDDYDCLLEDGSLYTMDVVGQTTAYLNSHNLYLGSTTSSFDLDINITYGSTTAVGVLRNQNGNITMYSNANLYVTLMNDSGTAVADKLFGNYNLTVDGDLFSDFIGPPPVTKKTWTVTETSGSNQFGTWDTFTPGAPGSMGGSWSHGQSWNWGYWRTWVEWNP